MFVSVVGLTELGNAGVAPVSGASIAGVLFTNRRQHTFQILSIFHTQIGVCLDGLLIVILGLCLVNPFFPSDQDRIEGQTCRPLRRPLARSLVRPVRHPLASKPFKAF